jgi:hypothetical protein
VASTGSCNLFQSGNQPGKLPQFHQYNKGEGAYNTDWNNFAPNVGFAWTLPARGGLFGTILGRSEGDSVLRAGYTLGYNRPGMSDFTGAIDDNPGVSQTANRTHALGNLGTPGSILLRNRADLGPPANLPLTRQYPMSDVVTGDIMMFEPNLQVPYAQTWTAGWQRKLSPNFAVEARYVGTRSDQDWITYNYNEQNLVENGILNEFQLAQANLQSHIAAGCGVTGGPTCSFAYRGPGTGTNPLPIALAYLTGRPESQAGSAASYTGTNWTSTTFVNPLARLSPSVGGWAGSLSSDAGRRANALTAGLPANFMVVNPDLLGGAEVVGNGGGTRYHSAQFELRKRLSDGFSFNASYVFGRAYILQSESFRAPWKAVRDGGTEGEVTHALKANWTYELPFGRGRRWASNSGPILDRIIGGWSFDGIARIQSSRLITLQGVRLVGMSEDEFQDALKIRFDHDAKLVWGMPDDIIQNTIRAFSISATSPTGYSGEAPTGRYLAPGGCISVSGNLNECTPEQLQFHGPTLFDFDLSAVKRVPIKGRVNAEFRAEFLNAFNTPYFLPTVSTSTNINNYRVTGSSGSRTMQLVFRLNY